MDELQVRRDIFSKIKWKSTKEGINIDIPISIHMHVCTLTYKYVHMYIHIHKHIPPLRTTPKSFKGRRRNYGHPHYTVSSTSLDSYETLTQKKNK